MKYICAKMIDLFVLFSSMVQENIENEKRGKKYEEDFSLSCLHLVMVLALFAGLWQRRSRTFKGSGRFQAQHSAY
jgi:hypothetical protein